MPPYYVRDLYDYQLWFEGHLGQAAGGVLDTEDGHLDVQVLGEPGEAPVLLVVTRQRLNFFNGAYLEFSLRVGADLEQRGYSYHFARADDSWIWRLDKHPLTTGGPPVPHIHQPPNVELHMPHDEVEVDVVVKRILDSGELEPASA